MRPHHTLLTVPLISALLFGVTACGSSDHVDSAPPLDAVTKTDATPRTASPSTTPTPSEPPSEKKRSDDAGEQKGSGPKPGTPKANKPAAKPTSRPTAAPSKFCAAVADLGDAGPPAADATPQLMRKLGSEFNAVAAVAPTSTTKEAWAGYAQVFTISADIKEGKASNAKLLAIMPNLNRWQTEMSNSIASCAL